MMVHDSVLCSQMSPQMDFRYCSKCAGDECYCPEHIANHTHTVAPHEPAKT